MIRILSIEGRNAPIMVCDVCGRKIEKIGSAALVCKNHLPEGETSEVYIVHKGECHEIAEIGLEAKGFLYGWEELRTIMVQLIYNVGSSIDDLREWEDHLNR